MTYEEALAGQAIAETANDIACREYRIARDAAKGSRSAKRVMALMDAEHAFDITVEALKAANDALEGAYRTMRRVERLAARPVAPTQCGLFA